MTETARDGGLTGVVLAGGYSRRFGETDKALARVGGRPLLARVVARLSEAAGPVVVNCRADQREAFEAALAPTSASVRFAEDPATDRGPLFGFRVALGRVETERCLLTTCDAPFLDPRLLADLAGRLGDATEAAGVGTPDGGVQPVQAAYRTDPAEAACDDLLQSGERRLSALFDRLAARTVPADEASGDVTRSLVDVDTPADRERAAEMLRRSGGRSARRERRSDSSESGGGSKASKSDPKERPRGRNR